MSPVFRSGQAVARWVWPSLSAGLSFACSRSKAAPGHPGWRTVLQARQKERPLDGAFPLGDETQCANSTVVIHWHLGEHTACDFPTNLRVIISERGRCFPHRKQDIVDLPGTDDVTNGEPPTLDLYRNPSSSIVVLLDGLLMPLFYLTRQAIVFRATIWTADHPIHQSNPPNNPLSFFTPSGAGLEVAGVPFGYSSAIRSSQ